MGEQTPMIAWILAVPFTATFVILFAGRINDNLPGISY